MAKFNPSSLLLGAALAAGCQGNDKLPTAANTETCAESGEEVLDSGCCGKIDSSAILNLSSEVSEAVQTVITASWKTAEPSSGRVIFGLEDGSTQLTNTTESDTSHEVLLLGVPQSTTVPWQVVSSENGNTVCSEVQSTETGQFSLDLPEITFTPFIPESISKGYLAVTILDGDFSSSNVVIINERGQYVWAYPIGQLGWRTRVAHDGSGLWVNHSQSDYDAMAESFLHVPFDGTTETEFTIDNAHVDFTELPDGTLAVLVRTSQYIEGLIFLGSKLMEVAPDGTQREVWNVFNQFTPDLTLEYTEINGMVDWAHVNGVSYDPATDSYYISISGVNTIAKVKRDGTPEWTLGDNGSSFSNAVGLIADPHSAAAYNSSEEGDKEAVALFNRRYQTSECPSAALIDLDPITGEASERWEVTSPDCSEIVFLGGAEPTGAGEVVLVFSTEGYIANVTAEGKPVWTLSRGDAYDVFAFSQAHFATSLYP